MTSSYARAFFGALVVILLVTLGTCFLASPLSLSNHNSHIKGVFQIVIDPYTTENKNDIDQHQPYDYGLSFNKRISFENSVLSVEDGSNSDSNSEEATLQRRLRYPNEVQIENEEAMGKSKVQETNRVTCKDPEGNPVTWWIVYKLPKISESIDPLLKQGSAHYYILPGASKWSRSNVAINDSLSIIGRTMVPLVTTNGNDVARVLYNDQPPDISPTVKDGHTKGVLLADEKGGLWMPHSIPHFPNLTSSFSLDYPPGGLENGQMLMCLSLKLRELNDVVGGLLEYTKATFYNSSIPPSLQGSLKDLLDVSVGNKTVKSPPYFKQFSLSSSFGNHDNANANKNDNFEMKVFAKGPKFHREIYADWIAREYGDNLEVQSWMNGAHPFRSNCTVNCSQVLNILEKQMLGQNFSHVDDHSKWAVGIQSPLVCVADLNRMKPQKSRGGVAVCMQDENVWKAFRSLVVETEPCALPLQGINTLTLTPKVNVNSKVPLPFSIFRLYKGLTTKYIKQ